MDGPNIIIIVCSALSLILRTIVLFKDFRHSQTTNGYQPLNAILLINGTLFKQFLVIGMIDDINYILGTVAPESIKNGFNAFCIISTIVSTYASLSEMFLAFFIFFIYAYTVQYRDITFMDRYGKLVYAFSYLTPLLLVSILFFMHITTWDLIGDVSLWCWIANGKNLERFFFLYFWVCLSLLGIFFLIIWVLRHAGDNTQKYILIFTLYEISFFITWIFPLADRINNWINPSDHNIFLSYAHSFQPLQGFLVCFVYLTYWKDHFSYTLF